MTRYIQNGLASLAAIAIFAISFSAIVTIPIDPTFAAIAIPIAA